MASHSFLSLILYSTFLIHSSHCLTTPATNPAAATKPPAPPTASSWQRRLDKALLDIDATPESRLRNFQRAVKDPSLVTDVTSAIDVIRTKGFGKGHPELINTLWPKGTTARADLEGLTALRAQLPEALRELPELVRTGRQQRSKKSSPSPSVGFGSFPKPEEIREELKNVLRSTPKGLETPRYKIVRKINGALSLGVPETIEIRRYEAFTVATTPSTGGTGFQTLASYLFGGNEEKKAMAMTMPVFVTGSGDDESGTMKFVLPSAVSGSPPAPLSDDAVNIERVPERLVAVKAFPGLVTDEEVSRQRDALLSALGGADGVIVLDGGEENVSVLQYNSPLTIPWRRRNEIAVVVVEEEIDGDDDTVIGVEVNGAFVTWSARTVATSWYDAGVRL